jgi:hypothetical protein
VKERQESYQREYVEGYDLWAGSNQAPRATMKRPVFTISELPLSEGFDLSKVTVDWISLQWQNSTNLAAPTILTSPEAARSVFGSPLLIAHHLGIGKIQLRWTSPRGPRSRQTQTELFVKVGITLQGDFIEKEGKAYSLFRHDVVSSQEFRTVTRPPFLEIKSPPTEVYAEFRRFWSAQRESACQGMVINKDSVNAVAQAVEMYFRKHREALERGLLQTIWDGSDSELVDSMRQLTAAKAMLEAFVSLGMPDSLGENQNLRDLLFSESMEKGKTRLLDQSMIETIAANGELPSVAAVVHGLLISPAGYGTIIAASNVYPGRTAKREALLEIIRDEAWIANPISKLEVYFNNMPDSRQSQPLIESTIKRLELLKKLHESAQPKPTLSQVALELRESVRARSHR